jgi:hypothetical protein
MQAAAADIDQIVLIAYMKSMLEISDSAHAPRIPRRRLCRRKWLSGASPQASFSKGGTNGERAGGRAEPDPGKICLTL